MKKYNLELSKEIYKKIQASLKSGESMSEGIERLLNISKIFSSVKDGSPFIIVPIPLQYILEVIYSFRVLGLSRIESVDKIAKTHGIKTGAVLEKCTRSIGLTIGKFDELLSGNKRELIKFLTNEFKAYDNQIRVFFRLADLL